MVDLIGCIPLPDLVALHNKEGREVLTLCILVTLHLETTDMNADSMTTTPVTTTIEHLLNVRCGFRVRTLTQPLRALVEEAQILELQIEDLGGLRLPPMSLILPLLDLLVSQPTLPQQLSPRALLTPKNDVLLWKDYPPLGA